jgi:hypothetical protein
MRATKKTVAGSRYLALQREARRTGRPTDELIQLYGLEGFLDRLVQSDVADKFVLKGGVLLAALGERRPTRDIDLAARALSNSADDVLSMLRRVAAIPLEDGLEFDSAGAAAEVIRENDDYNGVRVTLDGRLSRAAIHLHVDVNVGDPIWPEPQRVSLPRLLSGALSVRGYPLEMVLAEKIVTAITRGTANTRWRDFLDVYSLVRRHAPAAAVLRASIMRVAEYREIELTPLASVLAGYADIAQKPWLAWLRKNRLESRVPAEFSSVVELVCSFADPVIANEADGKLWEPATSGWR